MPIKVEQRGRRADWNEYHLKTSGTGTPANPYALIVVPESPDVVLSTTLTLDVAEYVSGDLLADTQEINGAYLRPGGTLLIHSISILDTDDNKGALNVVFLDSNISMGTENSAPNISDANAIKVLGHVAIYDTDYLDIGGCAIATVRGIGLLLQASELSTSLYVAVVGAATKTYTAAGLTLKIGALRS